MKFLSKPHSIEAFQFSGPKTKSPKWFADLYRSGKAFVVMNSKEQYIVVDTKEGSHKAYLGDWVCLNRHNTVFVLSDVEIKEEFTPDGK